MHNELDIIIPISLDIDWPTEESIISDILEQNQKYGFTKFALAAPCGGWRSIHYPPRSFFVERAEVFRSIKNKLEKYGIVCGWWNTLTIKSGKTEGFQSIVRINGTEHPFGNCPLDENFTNRISEDFALFAKIAKPAFIFLEDDFSLYAAMGCFCDLHMQEFERRHGLGLSREALVELLNQDTPEAIDVIKKWRQLAKDSMVGIAASLRRALDVDSPEIPMGSMQPGSCDIDGDSTEAVARALAGPRHIPFSRLYGANYSGIISREIPSMLYHILYSRQRIKDNFKYYFEADTFPHTRFFTSGCQIAGAMAVVFSYGFDGATFQTQQLLDGANEETAYGKAYARERPRFHAVSKIAKQSQLKGVGVYYDAFWNTFNVNNRKGVQWVQPVGRFGIPYTTTPSDVSFWDECQAAYADDAQIICALSKTLFLDSDAAKVLCNRGYGEYLGVCIGEDTKQGKLEWDLGTREVIQAPYSNGLVGTHMTAPWMLAPKGNGKIPHMQILDDNITVVSNLYTYEKKLLTPAMTKYRNKLGGNVVVMGLTLKGNGSQALYNYRRKHLFQKLLIECCDTFCLVKESPDVMIVENVATQTSAGFREMLTLVNMCEDPLDNVSIHLPPALRDFTCIEVLDRSGNWQAASYQRTEDGVRLNHTLSYCDAMFLLIK